MKCGLNMKENVSKREIIGRLWRVVMGRHEYLQELFNPLGHEVGDEGDAVS